jgi:hypothetical protein
MIARSGVNPSGMRTSVSRTRHPQMIHG